MTRRAILYCGAPARGLEWARITRETTDDLDLRVWPDIGDPAEVDYLAAWTIPPGLFAQLPNLKAVFSVGAGIDQLDLAAIPVDLPLVRMIEPGITACLTAWVAMAVLALHRDLPAYVAQQREGVWRGLKVVPPAAHRVGLLGLGHLGQSAAAALGGLGFPVAGWSRSAKSLPGIECHHGTEGMAAMLAGTDILVCLLPLTPDTRGMLNADLFARLPRGARLVNAGRGGHLIEPDLITALDSGQISAAVLDVAQQEPMPAEHPFWQHPAILLTPHVGAVTQVESGIATLLANIARLRAGAPIEGLIDRARGY